MQDLYRDAVSTTRIVKETRDALAVWLALRATNA